MFTYSKNPVLPGAMDLKKSERNRAETLTKAAELKLKREYDASRAMKDIASARQETLAKTARLRAERLARESNLIPVRKPRIAKK